MLVVYPFALLLGFLLYWAGARWAYLRRPPVVPGDAALLDWHFFVPCRDEEAVVGTTVARLRADFPAAAVWVIDDDSEDRTGAVVAALAADDPRVHLVRRRRPDARTGKGAALNAAYDRLGAFLPEGTDRSGWSSVSWTRTGSSTRAPWSWCRARPRSAIRRSAGCRSGYGCATRRTGAPSRSAGAW